MSEHEVSLSRGLPETVLPTPPTEWTSALEQVLLGDEQARGAGLRQLAELHPRFLEVWAALSDHAEEVIESYAYARVGYHRGLDALRAAGWRGTGYVRWRHPSNRGFLHCLDALRATAALIGESDEEDRCRVFLYQLDPEWGFRDGD